MYHFQNSYRTNLSVAIIKHFMVHKEEKYERDPDVKVSQGVKYLKRPNYHDYSRIIMTFVKILSAI